MKTVRKIFVVDTSLLLHDPRAILSFDEHIVVVPFPVLEELDAHKRRGENGTATAARQVIRILDGLREKGEIHRGIETPGGGILLVDTEGFSNGVKLLDVSTVDNFIISVAMKWRSRQEWLQKKQGREKQDNDVVVDMNRRFTLGDVVLITKDINLRVKAGACKVAAQDYLKDRAASSQDELYTGLARIVVSDGYFEEVGRLLTGKKPVVAAEIANIIKLPLLLANQCCIFEDSKERSCLAIYKAGKTDTGEPAYFSHVPKPKQMHGKGGIEPRNNEQAFAYALLMDTEIRILTFAGIAGSGKTLMALLAGLRQTVDLKRYEEILVYRSNSEIGEKLGFLKGSLKQKFGPWAVPIYDVLHLIALGGELELFETTGKKRPNYDLEQLFSQNKIAIDPINFIQGRSLHYKFVVVDETQNFKPGDIKKVITRVGKGTKIVLTGDIDPAQIQNPYLDSLTNGLSHVIERVKGQPMFGHLSLQKSERSDIAQIAAQLL